MHQPTIIADRAEFIDALRLLKQGHVLVKTSDNTCGCLLDGAIVYHSYPTLKQYGLIDECNNPQGFPNASYYRLTPQGRDFAERAVQAWQQKPMWQRLAVRFTG